MKKLFISQPMKGKSDEEILRERKRAIQCAERQLNEPVDAKPLWFLGKSLELLAGADIAYFTKDWEGARGCRIEHTCALEYGIETVVEDYSND